MLKLPDLNDQDFQSVVETAVKQIKTYGENWTSVSISDPGITFIELLAYLKINQQEAINKIGEKNLYKFLPFLGIKKGFSEGAQSYVSFEAEKDTYIPKGTKLKAFDVVFETKERIRVLKNKIIGLGAYLNNSFVNYDYNGEDISRKINVFGGFDELVRDFYIIFKDRLPENENINFFVEINSDTKRNKITDPERFVKLSEIKWEYYSNDVWNEAEIISDETYGFLFSGQVILKIKDKQEPFKLTNGSDEFCLRVKVSSYGFEKPPVLENIRLNCAKVIQQDTKCETVTFTYKEFEENKMFFDSYLGFFNKSLLFVKNSDKTGFEGSEETGILFMVKAVENMMFQLGTSDREILKKRFLGFDDEETVFILVSYSEDFFDKRILGSSHGYAEQIFSIRDFDKTQNIDYKSFQIMIKGKENKAASFKEWEKSDTFDSLGPKDRAYILNPKTGMVKFGNNIKGKVPSCGNDNILVVSMKTNLGDLGNIQKGLIKSFKSEDIFYGVKINHFKDACKGENEETSKELIEKALNAVRDGQKRIVTLKDYEESVYKTQGVIINDVKVIPLYKPFMENYPSKKEENTVTVVVEPLTGKNKYTNLNNYILNIKENLEALKLITTKIYVMIPKYFPIDIYCDIVAEYGFYYTEDYIRGILEDYINNVQRKKTEPTIFHGDLYGVLENMENILNIKYLKMELVGKKSRENNFGDIKVPPYAKVYLRNIYLTIDYK